MNEAQILVGMFCAGAALGIFCVAIVRWRHSGMDDLTFWKLQTAGWALLCAANVLL